MQRDTLFSSITGIHYTPADIINRAKFVLEGIELDPASDAKANQLIRAERFYSDEYAPTRAADCASLQFAGFDGLAQRWTARSVWLNPPFTTEARDTTGALRLNGKNQPIRERVIGQWVSRWRAAIRKTVGGNGPHSTSRINPEVNAALLLVPARTDTEWFQPLFGLAMCFIGGRLKFSDANNSAPFPTALIYSGPMVDRFYQVFEEVGIVGAFRR